MDLTVRATNIKILDEWLKTCEECHEFNNASIREHYAESELYLSKDDFEKFLSQYVHRPMCKKCCEKKLLKEIVSQMYTSYWELWKKKNKFPQIQPVYKVHMCKSKIVSKPSTSIVHILQNREIGVLNIHVRNRQRQPTIWDMIQ